MSGPCAVSQCPVGVTAICCYVGAEQRHAAQRGNSAQTCLNVDFDMYLAKLNS